jgi:hypothetical protein
MHEMGWHLVSATIGLTVTALAATTYRAHPGPVRPLNELAVLKLSHIVVQTVDGQSARICKDLPPDVHACDVAHPILWVDSIELLPGQHTIAFSYKTLSFPTPRRFTLAHSAAPAPSVD